MLPVRGLALFSTYACCENLTSWSHSREEERLKTPVSHSHESASDAGTVAVEKAVKQCQVGVLNIHPHFWGKGLLKQGLTVYFRLTRNS